MLSNNKRLERWTETGCRSVSSLVDLEDKEFSSGTGPYTGHSCGTFPRPQGHPVGWDSVSSDIDVMWKKLSLLSDITKLITRLSLFLCLCVLCLISEHQSPPPEVSVGQGFIIWSWFCFLVSHCLSFIVLTSVGRPSLKFEKPAFIPPSLCEGRFAGPLQYRVWKSMKGSIYPGTLKGQFKIKNTHFFCVFFFLWVFWSLLFHMMKLDGTQRAIKTHLKS